MTPLFAEPAYERSQRVELAPGAFLLPSFATSRSEVLVAELRKIAASSPFRRMVTPGGFQMSVEMTNCGKLGWITDKDGYRYESTDPLNGSHWPAMPSEFIALAEEAALEGDLVGLSGMPSKGGKGRQGRLVATGVSETARLTRCASWPSGAAQAWARPSAPDEWRSSWP